MQPCCTFKRVQIFAMVVAAVAVITVLLILFFFDYQTLARRRLIDAMVFKNDTESLDRFLTTKDIKNLRLSFYLYNVTNAQEVVQSSAKINLKEIGPFVYSEYKVKELVDNNQTSGLITYALRRRYVLDRNLSVADPAKISITWPNVPLLVARAKLDQLSNLQKRTAYWFIDAAISSKKEPAFITDTVSNFLFDGSKRELFEYLQKLDIFKLMKPWPLKDNKFGLLFGKNDTWNPTVDPLMTVSTGFGQNQTYENLNKFIYINGSSTLPFWKKHPPNCNVIDGTDGQFFSPFLDESNDLQVYSQDICRTLRFKFKQRLSIKGLSALQYNLDEKVLQSGIKNPKNKCYCLASSENGSESPECRLDGLMDLSSCVQPNIVASIAHFSMASPELLTRITGISPPISDLHEPMILIEPNTGLTVKVRVPLQFNVRIEKGGFKLFNFFQEEKSLILPLMWASETSELTEKQAGTLKNQLLLLDSWLVTIVLGGAIILIMAIFIAATILFIRQYSRKAMDSSERQPLVQNETQDPDAGTANSYQAI